MSEGEMQFPLNSNFFLEANPVRSRLVASPEEWQWSSAYTRVYKKGPIPDTFALPVVFKNPQAQRIGNV
jgi:hypothetical protein